jgi:magnesium-transporting ATPase (P-type)
MRTRGTRSLELARTLAVNALVCAQVFYLFNSRFLRESSLSFSRLFINRAVWIAVGVLAMLQLVVMETSRTPFWP